MLKRSLIIFCTSFFVWTSTIMAEEFPPQSNAVVQDSQNIIDSSQVEQLNEIVSKLPEKYKVVIIPATEEVTTQEYADQLFTHYNMSDHEMLLVLNMDKDELAVHAGGYFSEKGLTGQIVKDQVDHIFVPYAKQKSYMTGLSTLLQQFSSTVKNGGQAQTSSSNTEAQGKETEEQASLPAWLYYLVGVILLILSIGLYSFFQRRRLFKEMDEIEDWLDTIEDKVKKLDGDIPENPKGQANQASAIIERVRRDALPTAEFNLLEAEALCDRFRYRRAAQILQKTKDQLAQAENDISQFHSKMFQSMVMLEECERLVDEIKKTLTVVGRKLDEAKFQFGVTFPGLSEKHQQVEQWIKTEDSQLEEDVAQWLEQLKERKLILIEILKEVDEFPQLKNEVAVTIEKDLRELRAGLLEMVDNGYRIPLEHFTGQLDELMKQSDLLNTKIKEGKLEGLAGEIVQLKEKIDLQYDQMEEIVTKKALVQHYLEEMPAFLASLDEERESLKEELEELSLRYSISEGTVFNYYVDLERVCKSVADQLFLVEQMKNGDDMEFIQAADLLDTTNQEIETLLQKREEAYQELDELRKGEYDAQDTVMMLHTEIVRIEQQVRRENLPGTPPKLMELIYEGKKALFEIEMALNQVPLELHRVNGLVRDAKEFNKMLVEFANKLFEYCRQAEEKIQQTNRFRSQWKDVNQLLQEAEQAFRELDFEAAYSLASEAEQLAAEYDEGIHRIAFRRKK
ncbi:septation ring formation regulator EzrA [Ammoniphilus resinae]|uniref:Septation ring formation regulator EzrA n=1 Tax=Ammoniphilus resinae TaxID=861532 RepID=A0ABS4GRN8_9BACL|nr:septation ring formation regulator EzrA [Ammoniphilus resinae]MBP1932916.1 septation ring formation regulator EzrA [Ammoniphilus resinae]